MSTGTQPHPAGGSLAPLLVLALVLAACSILYELLAAQTLSVLAANTVVWYSLVVGLYLASMGVGAFFSEKLGQQNPWRSLVRIELALTLIGCLTVPLIRSVHTVFAHLKLDGSLLTGVAIFYCVVVPIVVVLGLLTGMELPLLMRLARRVRDSSRAVNQTLGWDYIGSLVGAMLFPLVLLPMMNLTSAGLLIASINLAVAGWIILARAGIRSSLPELAIVLAIATGLLLATQNLSSINQYFLQRYFYFNQMEDNFRGWFAVRDDLPEIRQHRSPYQVINLVWNPNPVFHSRFLPAFSNKLREEPDFPLDYLLFLNGAAQTDTRFEEIYHEWFAHVPVAMAGKVPEKILVLGGGDGFLIRELLKYEGIREIQHVDIDEVLIEFAKTNEILRRVNRDSLIDSRVTTIITDGYQFVRQSDETYDAIFIDFPIANTYDLAKLYSREFYEFVRQRLRPDGFAVFDSSNTVMYTPGQEGSAAELSKLNPWPVYSNTLMQAGFKSIVPYFSTLEIDNPEVERLINEIRFALSPQREAELAEIGNPARRELQRRKELKAVRDQMKHATSDYLKQGFIFMSPDTWAGKPSAEMLPGDLRVLNEQRLALALTQDLVLPERVDPRWVNSITRPTLPVTPWWLPMTSH